MNRLITDNLATWTSAPNGIKKLRELILELAVRGLLVPQDPNDEPANVLLEKIAAEKANPPRPPLGKGGENEASLEKRKVSRLKKVPPFAKGGLGGIRETEKPFVLPKGWEWTKLGEISQINPRNNIDDELEVSFIPMTLISTSHKGKHQQEKRQWSEIKTGFTHFAEGDIGIAKITPCFENSKAAVFSELFNGYGAGTTELHIVRPFKETLLPRYVLIYFKSPQFLLVGETKMTGTAGQKRLPREFVTNNPFPLPPLAEQHRIVAKVDELMQLCDQLEQKQSDSQQTHRQLVSTLLTTLTEARDAQAFQAAWSRIAANFDALFTTLSSVEQLQQTILQLAVMGKLVPQNPDDEPASELLKKIAEEKARLIAEGKFKASKPLRKKEKKDIKLPQNWESATFQDITKLITCGMASTPKYYDEGKIFLSAKNIKPYKFMPEDHKFIDDETYRKITQNAKPERGDILLTRVGAGIGEAALIDKDIDFAFYVSLTLIKPFQELLNSAYLLHWLNSPEGVKKSLENVYGSGVSQGNLNVNQVRYFELPIPPLAEQHRIVAKVDELMTLCEQLKTKLQTAQTLQQQLAQTLVQQAVA